MTFVFTSPPVVIDAQGGQAFVHISTVAAQAQWALQQVELGTLDRNEALALRLIIDNLRCLLRLHELATGLPAAVLPERRGSAAERAAFIMSMEEHGRVGEFKIKAPHAGGPAQPPVDPSSAGTP